MNNKRRDQQLVVEVTMPHQVNIPLQTSHAKGVIWAAVGVQSFSPFFSSERLFYGGPFWPKNMLFYKVFIFLNWC